MATTLLPSILENPQEPVYLQRGNRIPTADFIALLAIVIIAFAALVPASLSGLQMKDPLWIFALTPGFLLILAFGFHCFRPNENNLFQILLYSALWLTLPVFGVQLSYVAALSGAPLQDELFFKLDRTLGFDWPAWAKFVQTAEAFHWVTARAYLSYAMQPYIAVLIFGLLGSRKRNAEFFLAACVALSLTIAISAALPAIEPGWRYGFPTPAADILIRLRAGDLTDLPYIGIICFPSFHTASAVIFIWIYRELKWALIPAVGINLAMLASIPFSGDHYLVDMLCGIAVALAAVAISQCVINWADRQHQSMCLRPARR